VDQDEEGAPRYIYRHPKHGQTELNARDVFHIRGLGFDGMQGYSVVTMARDSLGLTIAAEKFGAKFFGQGARPSGVVTLPGHLSDEAFARLKRDFAATHSGIANSHRVAFLEQGMQWQTIGIPPEDAQFLQTRAFQIGEVARWFNIPVSKLRDSGGANYASLEQENMAFLAETLRPWLIRWEQEISAKLLLAHEKPVLYAEHLVDAILRVDLSARYNAYSIGRNWGWLSVNDIRAKEGMDPVEGGDIYLQPLNMQPLQAPAGPSAPTATPAVVAVAPNPSPAAATAGVDNIEANDLGPCDSSKRLAEAMTEHQIGACEHGKTNRCPICGIKKERELIPPSKPGGEHAWGFQWVPI
jgi:HK97 family phage portal protein